MKRFDVRVAWGVVTTVVAAALWLSPSADAQQRFSGVTLRVATYGGGWDKAVHDFAGVQVAARRAGLLTLAAGPALLDCFGAYARVAVLDRLGLGRLASLLLLFLRSDLVRCLGRFGCLVGLGFGFALTLFGGFGFALGLGFGVRFGFLRFAHGAALYH